MQQTRPDRGFLEAPMSRGALSLLDGELLMLAARVLVPGVGDAVAAAAPFVLGEHGVEGLAEGQCAGAPAAPAPGHVAAVVYEAGALVAFAAPRLVCWRVLRG